MELGTAAEAIERVRMESSYETDVRTLRTKPYFWKISHGANKTTGLTNEEKQDALDRQVVVVNRMTSPIQPFKVSQGFLFEYAMRKGDFFYLCYASQMVLLGQIVSDYPEEGSAMMRPMEPNDTIAPCVEWGYRIIKKNMTNSKYTGVNKLWTPNHNSTFVRVPEKDFPLLNSEILSPFFDTNVKTLLSNSDEYPNAMCWLALFDWNVNLQGMGIGETIDFPILDEHYKKGYSDDIVNAREGELVFAFRKGNPARMVAVFEVETSNMINAIAMKKLCNMKGEITTATLNSNDEFANLKFTEKNEDYTVCFAGVTPESVDQLLRKHEGMSITDLKRKDDKRTMSTISGYDIDKLPRPSFMRDVFLSKEQCEDLKQLVLRKKNVILQGPPGVGKTFTARRLAWSVIGDRADERIGFVQFHQSYTYENFIMGYKPEPGGGFRLEPGVFFEFCEKARADEEHRYCFIIDEINRGNLSKIFGELLMLVEADKRGNRHYAVKLPGCEEFFSVPENIYIIGMMNTADRSLALIDYALRRRFSFFEMEPAFDHPRFVQQFPDDATSSTVLNVVKDLNKAIISDPALGTGFQIGHSFFCKHEGDDADSSRRGIVSAVKYDIIPLLREYWFDNDKKFEEWRNKLIAALHK